MGNSNSVDKWWTTAHSVVLIFFSQAITRHRRIHA